MHKRLSVDSLCAPILLIVGLCSLSFAQSVRYETSVAPLPDEDIASSCHYELTIPSQVKTVIAVWVIFDRGRDVHELYSDEAVLRFAEGFRIALLLHGHCPGKRPEDHNDMNMDPARGLGRALSAALDQFAAAASHRELTRIPLIFLGFSGAGPLSARLAASYPKHVLAAILSAPGHYEPLGINTIELSSESLHVPQLIIAGGSDKVSGTALPYQYFRKYRDRGAPWAFIAQNGSPHCCTATAKQLILSWLEAVLKERGSGDASPLREVDQRVGWLAFFKAQQTEIVDSFGLKTFEATAATIEKVHSGKATHHGWESAGWLPNHAIASEWLAFVKQEHHPILPLN
jgi:dienelactone hydrolase